MPQNPNPPHPQPSPDPGSGPFPPDPNDPRGPTTPASTVTIPVPEGTSNLLDPAVQSRMIERGKQQNAFIA